MNENQDETIQGFWHDLERDGGDVELWNIYCDYLEDQSPPQSESTRLWLAQRSSALGEESRSRLNELLTMGRRPLLPRRVNSIGIEFVFVPRGTFWMSEDGENAQREAHIDHDFYLGIYQVTQEQWESVIGENPAWHTRSGHRRARVSHISDDDLKRFPVERVSWDNVQEFIYQLNEIEIMDKSGLRYRLPYENEWEYACRGAVRSKEDCNYDFYLATATDRLTSNEAACDLNPWRPSPVGSFEPNILGIHDMHGNVMEWCQDENADGTERVVRGGNWEVAPLFCRAARRSSLGRTFRYENVGFRLLATAL